MQATQEPLDDTQSKTGAGYRALVAQVRDAGLLEPRPLYYVVRTTLAVAAFVGGWVALFVVGHSLWAALAIAAFLAAASTQIVFLGHDAGHGQIYRSRGANRRVGLFVGNALSGLSYGWWVPKHNAHHAHPNQVDRDPDIGRGVIAFTSENARRKSVLACFLTRWQAWLFFPLLLLEGIALQVASARALLRRRDRQAVVEGALLTAHACFYLGLVAWALPLWQALGFIAVHQGLTGLYIGSTFAPNHKGMPILDHDSEASFLQRQVVTSRNVRGGRVTSVLLGGLNYQIEHHLFPSMPSANLAKAKPVVQAFCRDNGLPYQEDGLISAYRQTLRHLGAVGKTAV